MSAYPEDLFRIDIKVMVGNDVSETNRAFPVNLRVLRKKAASSDFVYTLMLQKTLSLLKGFIARRVAASVFFSEPPRRRLRRHGHLRA